MWVEKTVRDLAGHQHGLVTRVDLWRLGITRHEIDGNIDRGRLDVVHPGIYNLDSVPPTWKTMVLGGVLSAGQLALASHRCAAALWGFDAVYGSTIEVTVPYLKSPEPDRVLVHRTRRSNPEGLVDGIPTTTPERTIFDLAPILPARVLEKAARSAVHAGLTTSALLDEEVGRSGGRGVAGTRRMRWLVQTLAADRSGSASEIDLKYIIFDSPIPRPIQQLRIQRPDGSSAYPDFAWTDLKRIVEADGFVAHGSPEQLQEDLRRQNDLMDLGWEIRRFTATEIREHPLRVQSEIVRFIQSPVL